MIKRNKLGINESYSDQSGISNEEFVDFLYDDSIDPINDKNEANKSDAKKGLVLKDSFVERYKKILGETEYENFLEYSNKYIRKTIRVNTLKISVQDLLKRMEHDWILSPVPWCKEGFWIEYRHGKRFDIGNTPEHQLGYIYVQDAASMIPPVVLEPRETDIVLDICAAPGSKSSQIAQAMHNKGLLISNDSQGKRISALGINMQRCGVHNAIITNMDGERLKGFENFFDKILVDAPCSGTGTIRRNYKIAAMWSPNLVNRMSKIQYRLLTNAFRMLKKEGILVYSTCTMEPEENEGVVDYFLRENKEAELMNINLKIKRSAPVNVFNDNNYSKEIEKCLRIYPQDNDTEGFFVAKIHKKG